MLERMIPFAHRKISEYITKESIVVDMTAGNGNDALYLASLAKKVYAFDVQKVAIDTTYKLLNESNILNVELIHDSHVNIQQYVVEKIQCAVFNLGYLPNGDSTITTTASTTIKALQNLFPLLNKHALVSITLYIGHHNGALESNQIRDFVSKLPSKHFDVFQYSNLNKKNAPYNIFIEKIGE